MGQQSEIGLWSLIVWTESPNRKQARKGRLFHKSSLSSFFGDIYHLNPWEMIWKKATWILYLYAWVATLWFGLAGFTVFVHPIHPPLAQTCRLLITGTWCLHQFLSIHVKPGLLHVLHFINDWRRRWLTVTNKNLWAWVCGWIDYG